MFYSRLTVVDVGRFFFEARVSVVEHPYIRDLLLSLSAPSFFDAKPNDLKVLN